MKKIISLLASIYFALAAHAQDEPPQPWDSTDYRPHGLSAVVRVESNKIILRWAPTDYSLWTIGNEHGYVIERMAAKKHPYKTTEEDVWVDEDYKIIANLKPWTLEEFQQRVTDTSDLYAGVAMELLYGDPTPPSDIPTGASIESMVMDQSRRFGFAVMSADFSAKAATALALRFEDIDVQPGYFYEYRIRYNYEDKYIGTDTVLTYAYMNEPNKPQAVTNCFLEEGDGAIVIKWIANNDDFFSAYDIERSTDNKTWTRLNKRPFVSSKEDPGYANAYIDTNVINGKAHFYRLRGYTPFGMMSDYSVVMKGAGKDLTPPAPAYAIQADDDGGVVMITWEAMPNEPDFDGFYVGRSYLATGGFEKISQKLPKDARAFVDFTADPLNNNYYVVISADKAGNEAMSYVALGYIVDSMPPAVPTGLKGEVDNNGIVSINWDRGPEADIIGYRVYWANDTISEFSQLTGDLVPGINYTDSVDIRTLSEEVYYTVVAVDHRYNHSEMSKPLRLLKPDLVPPAAPVMANYQSAQLSVEFSWINSSSTDVIHHRLERKQNDDEWQILSTLKSNETNYRDRNLIAGSIYNYRICAVDDANNETCSEPLAITALDRGTRAPVTNLRATAQGEGIILHWDYPTGNNFAFVVYEKRGEHFAPVARLANDARSYIATKNVTFGVRVVYSDGGESVLVEVKL